MTQKKILNESIDLLESIIHGSAWYLIPDNKKKEAKKLISEYEKIKNRTKK